MTSSKQRSAARSANALADAWEVRTSLVKEVLAAERVASDAKTARLKALRLEKERMEAEAAQIAGDAQSVRGRKK